MFRQVRTAVITSRVNYDYKFYPIFNLSGVNYDLQIQYNKFKLFMTSMESIFLLLYIEEKIRFLCLTYGGMRTWKTVQAIFACHQIYNWSTCRLARAPLEIW